MKLYIETENGQVKNHPATEENLILAFGKIPEHWEHFVRSEEPTLESGKAFADPKVTYEKINGIWTDVFYVRDKTPEEKTAEKQLVIAAYKEAWAAHPQRENFSAWVFNEETLKYDPPFPKPTDGKFYRWHGPSNNWKEAEPFPQDGKRYTFDFINWVNVEIA